MMSSFFYETRKSKMSTINNNNNKVSILCEATNVKCNGKINSSVAYTNTINISLNSSNQGYFLRIGNEELYLNADMEIFPNRFSIEGSALTPIKHNNSLTISGTNGYSFNLIFNNERVFLLWHKHVRECIANLILKNVLQNPTTNSSLDIDYLVHIIALCNPLVDSDDFPDLKRVKDLWSSKLRIHDIIDRMKTQPKDVSKSELKQSFENIVMSNSDSLLKSK